MKLPEGYVPGVGVPKQKGGYGGFGQKMLEKMGWQRGQGLGKGKKGMSEAIAVSKKEDTLGVGATQTGWKWDWKYWEDAYSRGLQSVAHDSGSGSGSGSDSDSGSGSGDDDAGGSDSRRAAGSGAESDDDTSGGTSSDDSSDGGEPALGRLLACAVAVNRDGTLATASSHELQIARSLSKDPRGWAGRFSGREGKMARIRAQEEQQAAEARSKLGITPAPSGGAVSGGGGGAANGGGGTPSAPSRKRKAGAAGNDTDAHGGATDADSSRRRSKKDKQAAEQQQPQQAEGKKKDKGKKGSKKDKEQHSQEQQQQQQQAQAQAQTGQQKQPRASQKQEPARKPRVIVVALKGQEESRTEPFVPTPATGWWGAKMFSSAGRLEGMEDEQPEQQAEAGARPSKARVAFDEDTQAALYNRLQAAQRQGKRGLAGRGEVKIAGGNWEGKKTTFGEDDGAAEAEAAGDREKGKKKRKQRARDGGAEAATGAAGAEAAGGPDASPKRPKWASLAAAELERAPKRRLRWSALWSALQQQERAAAACRSGAKQAKQEAWARIQSSSKFVVEGKKVALAQS